MTTMNHTPVDAPEDIFNQRHQTLTELRNATLLIHPTKPTHYAQPRIGEHDVMTWSIYQANTLITTGLTTLDMLQAGLGSRDGAKYFINVKRSQL